MKKKYTVLCAAGVMMLALGACGGAEDVDPYDFSEQGQLVGTSSPEESSKVPEESSKVPEESSKVPEESSKVPEESSKAPEESSKETGEENIGQYAEVLDKYYQALSEKWNMGQLLSEGLSVLNTYCYEGEPLKNVGYALLDFDADGSDELLVGALTGDEFLEKAVFDMYTLADGTPIQLFSGQERDMYYFCRDEAGAYFIENRASGGAMQSAWYNYMLSNKELVVVQAILYEKKDDSEEAWYMACDTDWDTSNDSAIDKDLAQAVIESMESAYTLPNYKPFADYK